MFDVAKKLSREILVPSLSGVKGLSNGFLMRSPYTWVDPGNNSCLYIVISLLIILYVGSMKSDFLFFYSTDTFTHLTLVSD